MPIDFSNAWKTGVKIINEAIWLLPNVVLAIVILLFFPASRRSWQVAGAQVGAAATEASGDSSIARSPGPDKHFYSGFLDCFFRRCAIVQSR
jgi:hypothetical protein